ncbi:MAG: ATP-binding cassette domain-containing protein, partial [Xanthobacteraceae bacterium]|nr:ATP-binding cassette domain-containing protein [Xanthobacteraceae bacterium]
MPSPAKLEIDDLSMRFETPAGAFQALDHVSLTVRQGAFISLVGPSGCGKSTIFNIVAGLQEPTAGRVMID